jgi:hypothetical protein
MNEELHIEGISVTWNGREVAGGAPRAAAIMAGLLITAVLAVCLGLLLPALLAVHAALWLGGRRGFVYRGEDGDVMLEVPEGALTRRAA